MTTIRASRNFVPVSLSVLLRLAFVLLMTVALSGCGSNTNAPAIKGKGVRKGPRGIRSLRANMGGAQPASPEKQETNWTQYRGEKCQSITPIVGLPTEWSEKKNMLWRAELPGRGASSPVVFEDRVFLTSASGYGMSPTDRGAVKLLKHHVLCMDRDSGEYLWQRDIKGSPATQPLNQELLRHGFASSTPATDGKLVFTFFGCSGLFAFDTSGKLVWQADVGTGFNYFGTSASLMIHDDLLIVNASIESQTVFAFNKDTGEAVWKIDNIGRSWSMPVIGTAPAVDGREESEELIINEEYFIRGFNPKTGEELWHCEAIKNYVVATPFVQDGIVYCNGGLTKQMIAVKIGGRGDVTETHKVWEVPEGANVPSAICLTGYIYIPLDNGVMQCFDMRSGKLVHRFRMPTKKVYSSTLLADDLLYIPLEENGVMVLKANSKLEKVALNKIEGDDESMKTSLAPSGDRMFMRNDKYLYCISKTDEPPKMIELGGFKAKGDLIVPPIPYDFDVKTGRQKAYNLYLGTNKETLHKVYLNPYLNVLTDEQLVKSKQIINDKDGEFAEFRKQRSEAIWTHMKSGEQDATKLNEELTKIDKAVIKLSIETRNAIKKMFSKEQMAQHMKDAAEWQKKNKERIAKEKAEAEAAIKKAEEGK
ncbi:MAG: PQQ-binding-like beta-propeller repeat protein [Mariniblastus sp.]